jgi:hypothetical protein
MRPSMSKGSRWLQAIHDMLRDGLVVADNELRENDEGSTCKPVRIHRSGKCIVISLNAKVTSTPRADSICIKERLFPLFREREGIARMCDYWILCEHGDEAPVLSVLLCELKSGKSGGAVAQLENAKLLAEYFLAMVAHHNKLGMPSVTYRGFVFSRRPGPKAGLRPGKLAYITSERLRLQVAYLNDEPEYWLSALCA